MKLAGFGDVFPKDPAVVMINCAFIVLGIVLFGMCYFILQEEIREKADRASRHARKSLKRYCDNVVQSHRRWTKQGSTEGGLIMRYLMSNIKLVVNEQLFETSLQ